MSDLTSTSTLSFLATETSWIGIFAFAVCTIGRTALLVFQGQLDRPLELHQGETQKSAPISQKPGSVAEHVDPPEGALLLYLNTGSVPEVAIALLAVPFSLAGAVWLLWALGYHLSVAVWVGLIALAGLDAETGVVMLLYLKLAHRRRLESGTLRTRADLEDAIVEGAAQRIRPKLMTVLTTMIGLLPLLWSTGTGADVMQRIAAPMVGGLATSFLLELTVYPAVFGLWRGRGWGTG